MTKPTYRILTIDPCDEELPSDGTMARPRKYDHVYTLRGEHLSRGDLRRKWRELLHAGYESETSIMIEREQSPLLEPQQPTQGSLL